MNSLGMKFVPVPITGETTDGKCRLFGASEMRSQDYEVFASAAWCERKGSQFEQGPTHLVVDARNNSYAIRCVLAPVSSASPDR